MFPSLGMWMLGRWGGPSLSKLMLPRPIASCTNFWSFCLCTESIRVDRFCNELNSPFRPAANWPRVEVRSGRGTEWWWKNGGVLYKSWWCISWLGGRCWGWWWWHYGTPGSSWICSPSWCMLGSAPDVWYEFGTKGEDSALQWSPLHPLWYLIQLILPNKSRIRSLFGCTLFWTDIMGTVVTELTENIAWLCSDSKFDIKLFSSERNSESPVSKNLFPSESIGSYSNEWINSCYIWWCVTEFLGEGDVEELDWDVVTGSGGNEIPLYVLRSWVGTKKLGVLTCV